MTLFGKSKSADPDSGIVELLQQSQDMVDEAKYDSENHGDNRPNIYYDDNSGLYVYRASAIGGCITNLTYTRRGFGGKDAPAAIKAAWSEGNKYEDQIIRMFCEKYGMRRLDNEVLYGEYGKWIGDPINQLETEIKIGNVAVVRCHPDDIVSLFRVDANLLVNAPTEYGMNETASLSNLAELNDRFVLEVKKFAPSMYTKFLNEGFAAFPYYDWQFDIEMISTGLPGVFCVGVMKEDKSDIDFIDAWFYETPRRTPIDIMKRVMLIERSAEEAEGGGVMPLCEYKQYPCPHYDKPEHGLGIWKKEDKSKPDSEGKFQGEIEIVSPEKAVLDPETHKVQLLVYELNIAQELKKQYTERYEAARKKLIEELVETRGGVVGDYWHVGKYVVEITKVAGRNTTPAENKAKVLALQIKGPDGQSVKVTEKQNE